MSHRKVVDPYLSAFGEYLQSLRKKAGLTQEEIADKAGIHVTYLSGIERGQRNVATLNLRKIARALGVPTKELFFFEDRLKVK
jgi:transcriptional regulator with XRE-family HTH domain